MINQNLIALFTCILLMMFVTNSLLAQTLNDYRSVNSGNWTTVSIWEVYNGTTWVAATNYPGQVTGTNDVTIQTGDNVEINSNITNSINSLTINGNLDIAGTSSLNTLLVTLDGGTMNWSTNVSFSLPAGAALKLTNGGLLTNDGPCNCLLYTSDAADE